MEYFYSQSFFSGIMPDFITERVQIRSIVEENTLKVYHMTISEYVRQKLKEYRLPQRDLADRAGVGIRFVRELEAGKPTLRIDKVNVVLDLFGHRLGPVPSNYGEE